MPHANIFQWHDGAGWLILTGGAANSLAIGDVEALALGKAVPGEPIAYIHAAGSVESADQHLAALEDAGAPTGYLVDVQTEDDDSLREQLAQAGLIIIGDGPNLAVLRNGIIGAALEGIGQAFERGSSVLAIGGGAVVFGQKIQAGDTFGARANQIRDGLAWLTRALITPNYRADRDTPRVRALLEQLPDLYSLNIGAESALALGPNGEVELWGERTVGVTLGTAYVTLRPIPEDRTQGT